MLGAQKNPKKKKPRTLNFRQFSIMAKEIQWNKSSNQRRFLIFSFFLGI